MLTLEKLKEFGANSDEGLARCMNNEDFYLRMVAKSVSEEQYKKLTGAINAGELDGAFEAAHALKGINANLALTPILDPVCEITELLRGRTQADYAPYVNKIISKKDELKSLCD